MERLSPGPRQIFPCKETLGELGGKAGVYTLCGTESPSKRNRVDAWVRQRADIPSLYYSEGTPIVVPAVLEPESINSIGSTSGTKIETKGGEVTENYL
jgi:hypothetical protein